LTELYPKAPWTDVLENAAVHGLQLRRRGEPVVELSIEGPTQPVCYAVNPLAFAGHPALLFSDGGTGKSLVILVSAILTEIGGHLGSALRAVPGRSMILDWEQDRSVFNERLRGLVRKHPEWSEAKPLYKRMVAPLADDIPSLCKTIQTEGITLILLDSLGPAAGGDITSAETAMRTMQAIRSLGVTVLCTAHVAKSSTDRVSPFGSVFFRNLSRSAWRLDSVQEGPTVRICLTHDKSNFSRLHDPIGLTFHFADDAIQVMPFDPQTDPIVEANSSLIQRILQVLEQTGPQTAEALAGVLGSRVEPVKVALSKENGGRVRPIEKRGKQYVWALTEVQA
jgi:hypothetical protein